MKKLSVIIPNWNGEKYLAEMLSSIVSQIFTDWTLFVIDDGSTDSSKQIIKKFSDKDSRINLFERTRLPKGAQTCRNIGIELSKGYEYIMFFDSDDIIAPYCFQQRVTFMESHKDLDFSIFPAKKFYEKIWDNCDWVYGVPFFKDIMKAFLHKTLPMVGWTNIYRCASIYKKGLHWDEMLLSMQDSDFNIQAILKGCKYEFAVNYKPDYFYRYVTNSVSSKSSQRKQTHFPGHIYLLSKVVKSLSEDQKIYYRDDLDNYYLNFSHISVDKKYGSTFCKTDWIRGRSWFIFRMKILAKTHPKARILLFPKLGLQHNCMLKKWHCCMKKTAHDFVSKYKNN